MSERNYATLGSSGSTPSQIALDTGEHIVKVTRPGYQDWERKMHLSPGAKKTINAILEKA